MDKNVISKLSAIRQALPHLADGAAEPAVKPAISVKLAELEFLLADGHHAEHSRAPFLLNPQLFMRSLLYSLLYLLPYCWIITAADADKRCGLKCQF